MFDSNLELKATRQPSLPSRNSLAPRAVAACGVFLLGCLLTMSYPAFAGGVVDQILSIVQTINNKVTTIRTTTNATAAQLADLPQTVQDQLGVSLDPDVRDLALSAVTDIRTAINEQNAYLQNFGDGSPGTECYIFRQDLIALLEGAGSLADAMLAIGTVSNTRLPAGHGNTRDLVTVIENLPCPVLSTMSRPFAPDTPLGVLTSNFDQARSAVDVILPLYEEATSCSVILPNADQYRTAYRTLGVAAILFKIIGAIVDKDNMTGTAPISDAVEMSDKFLGIHGYAHITLKPPKYRRKIANMFSVLGDVSLAASGYAARRLRHCEIVTNQQEIVANQEALLAQQQDLMLEICKVTGPNSDACRDLLSIRP